MRRTQTGHSPDPILFNSCITGLHSSQTFPDSLSGSPKKLTMANPKPQTLPDLKNCERQSYFAQTSLRNRHTFPNLQFLDPEIQQILSIPPTHWLPLTTTQSIHIFSARTPQNTYIKTENLIPDQFSKIITLLTSDHTQPYWNPYLQALQTLQYTKDQYGVYDCLYKIFKGKKRYLISDKWLSLPWWHPKYFFLLSAS